MSRHANLLCIKDTVLMVRNVPKQGDSFHFVKQLNRVDPVNTNDHKMRLIHIDEAFELYNKLKDSMIVRWDGNKLTFMSGKKVHGFSDTADPYDHQKRDEAERRTRGRPYRRPSFAEFCQFYNLYVYDHTHVFHLIEHD